MALQFPIPKLSLEETRYIVASTFQRQLRISNHHGHPFLIGMIYLEMTGYRQCIMLESNGPQSIFMELSLLQFPQTKLQDHGKNPAGEKEVQFRLTRVTLEPMLRSKAYISQQLSAPANRVAVLNLKFQDTKTTSGETEVKFQVSKDTLGSMLRSMAYIREQL